MVDNVFIVSLYNIYLNIRYMFIKRSYNEGFHSKQYNLLSSFFMKLNNINITFKKILQIISFGL
jgi:hypothetical protein